MKAGVKDRDHGWRAIQERVRTSGRRVVAVGVQGDQAAAKHEGDGLSMAELATVHEFGAVIQHPGGTLYGATRDGGTTFMREDDKRAALGRTAAHEIVVPERSFIRATVDEHAPKYREAMHKAADQVLMGTRTEDEALGRFGLQVQSDIQRRIEQGIDPPLAAATIRAKGSSKPLVDTGALKNAVTFVVRDGGKS